MAWLLPIVTGLLCVLVALVAVLVLRVRRLERRLAVERPPPADESATLPPQGPGLPVARDGSRRTEDEYVITELGQDAAAVEQAVEALPVVEPKLFADIVLRETVVQAAGLVHGLRRALAPEVRNRIRFEVRREIRRSRKQRRADLRTARRQWEARQRQDLEDTAA